MTAEELEELEAILGHRFAQPDRLERALTHRSHRQNDAGSDNERLEFLGDRVLGLVASEHTLPAISRLGCGQTFQGSFPARECRLDSFRRAAPSASAITCASARAKKRRAAAGKSDLLADAYEAVLGAIYLDAGLEGAAGFLRRTLLEPRVGRRSRTASIAPTTSPRFRNGCSSAEWVRFSTAFAGNPAPSTRKHSKSKSGSPRKSSRTPKAAAKRKPSKPRLKLLSRAWNPPRATSR